MKLFPFKNSKSQALRFARDEVGTASVEFVLWVPVMALLFGTIVDSAMIMGGRSQVLRVVQDINRTVSIGRITSSTDAEDAILANISNIAPSATVSTTLNEGIIHSTVFIPVGDLAPTGLVDSLTGLVITVSAQHLSEN